MSPDWHSSHSHFARPSEQVQDVTHRADLRDDVVNERTQLVASSFGVVEHVRHGGSLRPLPHPGPSHTASAFRVCLPYRGLLVVHSGDEMIVGDSSQVLFNPRNHEYRLSEPVPGGYAEVCLTPAPGLLSELLNVREARLSSHPLFRRKRRRADLHLQVLRSRFLHRASEAYSDPLATEELLVATLRCALSADSPEREPSPSTRRLILRTKEFVGWHLSEPIRLGDIGRAVGASPAYLTDVFRRFEGLPIHQYALQLRLARGLIQLPHTDDLTTLALDLGFSSHSHFAAAFRRAFGCSPSEFRSSTRANQRRARLKEHCDGRRDLREARSTTSLTW